MQVIAESNVARKTPSSLIEVMPSGKALGAEVRNVDIKSFDDWQFAAFMRALLRHQVVLVRGQILDDRELITFCRRFGDVDNIQNGDHRSTGELRKIHIASNARLDGEPGTSATPLAITRIPAPLASVIYAPEAALLGAQTAFCSLYGVYDALPPGLRSRVAHLRIKHDGASDDSLARQHIQAKQPVALSSVVHPLVSTHPDTGRSMLYLGQRANARLLGLPKEESDDLLDELWQFAERPEFTWEHAPRPGDLLMWDNRCALRRRYQFYPVRFCAVLENCARQF
jgi:alpha-ketoglutarate-dependent taurine dioxygenase